MYPSTKEVYQKDFTYFRTQEYSNIVNQSLAKLSVMLGNKEKNSLIYLAASGTAAMEAVVENCVTQKDKALVINGGSFGQRFCKLLHHHNIPFDAINLRWNEELTYKKIQPYEKKGYTALFVNIHETSTGQLYNMQMLSDFCKENNMLLIIDAISSFLADEYDMEKYGIDVTIISSQKGLCLSPGMSIISFSKRMLEKIQNSPPAHTLYFDFKDYLKNIERGQTPYTPTVLIMYELQDMLNLIENEGGIGARVKDIAQKAKYFRSKAREYGFVIPEYPLSNMLTPLFFENINAIDLVQILKDKYHLFINPCSGELSQKLIRISHIGNINTQDIDNLLEKLKLSVDEIKRSANAK